MNDDEKDTPPAGLPPMPVASPRHPTPPRRDTHEEMRALVAESKKKKARRPLNYTLIATIVTALAAGVVTGLKKSDDAGDDAKSTEERLDRLERKVRQLRRAHDALKKAVPLPVDEPEPEEDRP